MRKYWHFMAAVLAVCFTLSLGVAEAGGKKKKRKKKTAQTAMDADLENEVFAVLERGTRSADMETRAQAVNCVGRLRADTAKEYLLDSLKDPQWIVRHSAIRALIRAGNPAYRKTLGSAVANTTLYDKPGLSPLNLVLGLPPDEAMDLLEEALVKVDDVRGLILGEIFKADSALAAKYYERLRKLPPVKSWVMNNLRIFKDKDMYPLLVKTIPELTKEEKLKAFEFLTELDKTYDVGFLYKVMAGDDVDLAEGAAYVLGRRGEEKAVDVLLPMCDENDVHRQLRCLNGVLGVPTHTEVLERAKLFLYGDPDPEVLYTVYDIFTRAKDDSVYDRMLQRLQSTNLGHRAAAVFFIGRMKGTRALPQLHQLLRDGSPIIRLRAAQAIGELQQAESVPYLADALRNDLDAAVKKELVVSLGKIGDKSIIDVVAFLIFDPTVREEAINALCSVRHRSAISTLRNVLQTQFTKDQRTKALKAIVRISPAEGVQIFKAALGWLPDGFLEDMAAELKGEFVEYLKAALLSINERVRREAVVSFRHLGADLEIQILERELFASKDNELRVIILNRLAVIKKQESVTLLEAFFKDQNRRLRLASIDLASKYSPKEAEAVKKLRGMLLDPDETYRVASGAALVNIFLGYDK